jgi:hypothetical protein
LVTRTACIVIVGLFAMLAVCARFTPQLVTLSQPVTLAATATTPASDHVDIPDPPATTRTEADDAIRDLYGNDVTSAVAKYTFDATGSLYEVHSPQTELPRLKSPKS